MKQYLELIHTVLNEGHEKADRTGTGTISIFGHQMRFDLRKGFPLVTTKRCHLRSIIHELLWFLKGDTNIQYLKDNNVTIWDEWANPHGDLGPVYGKQWREWMDHRILSEDDAAGEEELKRKGYHFFGRETGNPEGESTIWVRKTDQIQTVIDQLRNDPDSRRIIVSAWNVGELDQMALAPCHSFFQFYTRVLNYKERLQWVKDNCWEALDAWHEATNEQIAMKDIDHDEASQQLVEWVESMAPERILSCQLYQRSADVFLGVPFNIASYALLIHMVAQQVGMAVGDFVWTGGDTHLYTNHLEQATLQLSRVPHPLPKLVINRTPGSIFDYKFEDFEIEDYVYHPAIKAPVAI